MILDTSFLVDVLRGDEVVKERVSAIEESGIPRVSTVTIMELLEGVHLSDNTERERRRVEELLASVNEVTFDRECAMIAGRLNAALRETGQPIDAEDVMIAACAIVHDEPVVTRNVSHFERIDDVEVVDY